MYPKQAPERLDAGDRIGESIQPARKLIKQFLQNWDTSLLAKYYSPKERLGTYQVWIPQSSASELPKALGAEGKVKPDLLIMHYKGKVIAPETGTFRFVGTADDFMFVRFAGQNALDASFQPVCISDPSLIKEKDLGTIGAGDRFNQRLAGGKWFQVVKGRSYDIEIILGDEGFGGVISAYLLLQFKEAQYANRTDVPQYLKLPVFQTHAMPLPATFKPGINGPQVAEPYIFNGPGIFGPNSNIR
jgi:hypothetical protein